MSSANKIILMKNKITYMLACAIIFSSCDLLNEAAQQAENMVNSNTNNTETQNPLTNAEVISGLREALNIGCLLYTSPSPRDRTRSRMPSSA